MMGEDPGVVRWGGAKERGETNQQCASWVRFQR